MTKLQRLIAARNEAEAAIAAEVHALRAAGFAWSVIGAELGLTRQAAQQRYGAGNAPTIKRRPRH